MKLINVQFSSPVTLHSAGTVSSWDAKRMSEAKIVVSERPDGGVDFRFDNGFMCTVLAANVTSKLYAPDDAKPAVVPQQSQGKRQ